MLDETACPSRLSEGPRSGGVLSRAVALAVIASLLAVVGYAAKEKRIVLKFTPKENVTANLPALDGATPARAIEVRPLVDARALPDLSVVGENREHKTPRPVRATSSVADFATAVLRQCLGEWGVRLGKGGLVLSGEITNLFVMEDQTYSTAVSIRFRLEDSEGKTLWEGIATGDAHQWGRSFEEENYVEEISDALKRTYANLVNLQPFREAWAGRPVGIPAPATVAPATLKAKILEMMKAGISNETIVGYVHGLQVSPGLGSEEILDWKRSGVSEEVIRATLERVEGARKP